MARRILFQITLPDDTIGRHWNAPQLLRFLWESLDKAGDGTGVTFQLIHDSKDDK
jgi:hypothetical protein